MNYAEAAAKLDSFLPEMLDHQEKIWRTHEFDEETIIDLRAQFLKEFELWKIKTLKSAAGWIERNNLELQ